MNFKKGIDKTLKSTAKREIRPMFSGVSINHENDKIVFASTDSFRLSEYTIENKFANEGNPIILPSEIAKALSDFFKNKKGEFEIGYNDDDAAIELKREL